MVLWENHYSTKLWYTISCNFFNPEFLWNKRFPLRIFPVLWDKKVSIESRDIPFLCIKIFDKRSFLRNEGFPNENFRYCEMIIIRHDCETPSYAIFCNPELFWNTRVPLRSFSVLWDKKVSRENRDIPLLALKTFDKRTFLKTEGIPYEVFRYSEKIIFRQHRNTQSYAFFLFQNFSEKKGSRRSFFGSVRQKSFERKSWYPLPLDKFFRWKNFSEKWRVPLRNFSVLWENHYSTKLWSPILCNFLIQNFSETKGSS